jgi:soluble lytic murein transglycosylase
MRRSIVLLLAPFFLLPAFAATADNDPYAAARAQFRAAYAAAGRAAAAKPADSDALRAYPLYPYLQERRIESALLDAGSGKDPADDEAARFLAAHRNEPVARPLLRAWLSSLQSRQRWAEFLRLYDESNKSTTLRCEAATARIALHRTAGLAQDIESLWLSPTATPPQCEAAFDWLRRHHGLGPALVERRARLALADGNVGVAQPLLKQLPAAAAAPLAEWAALLQAPQDAIDALIAAPQRKVDSTALLAGWKRLSYRDPDAATARYAALVRSRGLDAEEAARAALSVAMGLVLDRRSEAPAWFDRAADAHYDDTAQEWRARAAIWNGDWRRLQQAVDAMPTTLREQPTWRYWAARATEQNGDVAAARALYAQVEMGDSYYAAAAAAALGHKYAPHPTPLAFDDGLVAQIAARPAFVRARELRACDLPEEAVAEWWYGYNTLPADQHMQAIAVAMRWDWYDQAVATATRQGIFNDYTLLYPRPYAPAVKTAAEFANLPPDLIYAVMRQESLYRSDAMSRTGALGLLQLMPATARRTAVHWQRPRPSSDDLLDPTVNLTLGAGQLRQMLDRFDGEVPVALAAYNAGPHAARR